MTSTIHAVTFDSGDAGKLATFWSQVVDRPVDADATAEFASISGLPQLMFIKVPENKTAKNRVHLDLVAAELDGEVARLVALGARAGQEHNEGGAAGKR